MQAKWAEENLQVIRTIMERSAVYQRALGPIMVATGILGTAAAVVGCILRINTTRGFVSFWLAVSIVTIGLAFVLARRQALKDREPFWSGPTQRVAYAMLPALFAGFALGQLHRFARPELEVDLLLPLIWIWLYGCAIHSAGSVTPPGMRTFAWILVLGATALAVPVFDVVRVRIPFDYWPWIPHLIMGVFFGALHLLYGIKLLLSKKTASAA
jgi:hypothetical protein